MTHNNHTSSIKYIFKFVALLLVCAIGIGALPQQFTFAQEAPEGVVESVPEEPAEESIEPEPEEDVEEESEISVIETGDAVSGVAVENEVNTNHTDTDATDEELEEGAEEENTDDSSEENNTEEADNSLIASTATTSTTESDHSTSTTESTVDVKNTNNATSTNQATSTADTGNNTVSGGNSGSGVVVSGNAIAYADVLNVINTNLTNSEGLIEFFNNTLGYTNFDLRNHFASIFDTTTALSTNPCNLDVCDDDSTHTTVTNNNDAYVQNDVIVTANTGGNTATGTNAHISTGDAYASANVLNVVNTNITDSNYLLLVFNNFDNYAGDVILPSSAFFNQMMQQGAGNTGHFTNSNQAYVDNSVTATANTGNNTATGSEATILTGTAHATAGTYNQINQNFFNTNSFNMVIRVQGDWDGEVFGLPAGISWARTPAGIQLYSENTDGNHLGRSSEVTNTNNAVIQNNVEVYALTGENEADAEAIGVIETGNAHADATVFNLANTNIVGSNWSSLFFNIYGNWRGNISFGQTDLWLGLSAEASSNGFMPGEEITVRYTVFNQGDATANDVQISNNYFPSLLSFNESAEEQWQLGSLAPGQTIERTYIATISDELENDVFTSIPLSATVSSYEPDANEVDNTDTIDITAGAQLTTQRERGSLRPTFHANIDLEKTANRDLAQPGDVVEYSVSFTNHGGQLYDAALIDVLEDETGTILSEQVWPLDTVFNGEEITIEYSIEFDSSTATGTYTNSAQVVGWHGSQKPRFQTEYASEVVTHRLQIGDQRGQVLGISTCEPYITQYLKYGEPNPPQEVTKLQQFLNQHQSASLTVNGEFNLETEIAVRDFQTIHADEILDPWGLEDTSGFVYYTTQKKINEIMCQGQRAFPLSLVQEYEINQFKDQIVRHRFASDLPAIPTPELTEYTPPLPARDEWVEVKPTNRTISTTDQNQQTPKVKMVKPKSFTSRMYTWFNTRVSSLISLR